MKVFSGDAEAGSELVDQIEGAGNGWSEVGTRELGNRIRAILVDGTELGDIATFRDGAINQRVTDAIHASAAQGSVWVDVAPMP